ncbi:MAG: tail fiber domain-containing protein [Chthoniobacterales bacterium]|nr:tail fiber domain-containing protein [Chthoniobacterales bacterium]
MYYQNQIIETKVSGRESIGQTPSQRVLIPAALALALAWFAVSPTAQAVSPAPDGGYPNGNTAEGEDALFSLTTGPDNTAVGFNALFSNTTGDANTANGFQALLSNTTGGGNTATGVYALEFNTTGFDNTANGVFALQNNTTGSDNTANGLFAATRNTTGTRDTANGFEALFSNTTGFSNTANGAVALGSNTTGFENTADGDGALASNTTGKSNIAVGFEAGVSLTTGNDNVDIGNAGRTGEAKTIRIGKQGTQMNTFIAGISGVTVAGGVGVIVDTKGHLGTVVSSARFKEAIEPMDKASEAILALKPVTFHYKPELDPRGIPQFGLVAEQVAKVNPDLVARDDQGKPYTVRYEAVNAMLLNEFLKEHREVQELKATAGRQQSTAEQQQKEITALTAALKAQAAQIQEVSERLEGRPVGSRLVANEEK